MMLRRLLPPTRYARGSGIFLFHTRGLRPGLLICRPDGLKKIRSRNDRLSQLFTLQSQFVGQIGASSKMLLMFL